MTTPSVTILAARIQHFSLWDGEVVATVSRHMGVHGFPDALIVVHRQDDPLDATLQYNPAYRLEFNDEHMSTEQRAVYRTQQMDKWIEDKLVELATSERGDTCEIMPVDE